MNTSSDAVAGYGNAVAAAVENGKLEAAYVLIGGGSVYVVNADDTEELALKVRSDPLFKSSHTEIHPIADASDFLERAAHYM